MYGLATAAELVESSRSAGTRVGPLNLPIPLCLGLGPSSSQASSDLPCYIAIFTRRRSRAIYRADGRQLRVISISAGPAVHLLLLTTKLSSILDEMHNTILASLLAVAVFALYKIVSAVAVSRQNAGIYATSFHSTSDAWFPDKNLQLDPVSLAARSHQRSRIWAGLALPILRGRWLQMAKCSSPTFWWRDKR